MFGSAKKSEAAYRQGIGLWDARDLRGAVQVMGTALMKSRGPDSDPWWFALSRALAQIHLENDDPQTAGSFLEVLPWDQVGMAQTLALRAKASILAREAETAEFQASAAVQVLDESTAEDLGSSRNGVIALSWVSEVLVDLGYGDQAERVVAMAEARAATTAMTDSPVMGTLVKSAARAARLMGDPDRARAILGTLDTSVSPDFEVEQLRELARLDWEAGDRVAARAGYESARDLALENRYAALAADIVDEMEQGPPSGRKAERPVEEWVQVMEAEAMAERSYAVVVEIEIGGDLDPLEAMEAEVQRLLDSDPSLGTVDGVGTDGETWMLFLDGDDPEKLWSAVRHTVESPGWTGQVTIRQDEGSETFPLGQR